MQPKDLPVWTHCPAAAAVKAGDGEVIVLPLTEISTFAALAAVVAITPHRAAKPNIRVRFIFASGFVRNTRIFVNLTLPRRHLHLGARTCADDQFTPQGGSSAFDDLVRQGEDILANATARRTAVSHRHRGATVAAYDQ